MSGRCWLADSALEPWERAVVAAVQTPVQRGGVLLWDLDRVPPGTLRALCWPRRPAARRGPWGVAAPGARGR